MKGEENMYTHTQTSILKVSDRKDLLNNRITILIRIQCSINSLDLSLCYSIIIIIIIYNWYQVPTGICPSIHHRYCRRKNRSSSYLIINIDDLDSLIEYLLQSLKPGLIEHSIIIIQYHSKIEATIKKNL
jgi:hypothetical protein